MDTARNMTCRVLRRRVELRGAVQGVGFRPFVFRHAQEMGLNGWVRNTPQGLSLEIEGAEETLQKFLDTLASCAPRQARIEDTHICVLPTEGLTGFAILESDEQSEILALPQPDLAVCEDCLREVFDPAERRYRYPFTNCTACGPRYSIMDKLPYDRPNTTMSGFAMCPECAKEYGDPNDRRFHAQPNACPICGPHLTSWNAQGETIAKLDDALLKTCDLIRDGKILAVKGLGGFHLVCDARNEQTVRELRQRKRRPDKPLATMWPNATDVSKFCFVDKTERDLLTSQAAPIVLLKRRQSACNTPIAPSVAPGNPSLGVMLPYMPLHHLLMAELGFQIVATSGNQSDEPIVIDESEALQRLGGIADAFLVHDRPILRAVDDSIVRVIGDCPAVLRRARGYAPLPPIKPAKGESDDPSILALGAHMKNTIAISKNRRVVLGAHIGDLGTPEAIDAFDKSINDLSQLFDARPDLIACDLHPDYVSTDRANHMKLPIVRVQHHVAHAAACMAEHNLSPPLLGVAWDGTGFGPDGTIWGGEFLEIGERRFERTAHLKMFQLPGGTTAIKEPRRAALGILWEVYGADMWQQRDLAPIAEFDGTAKKVLTAMLTRGINSPLTSSAGRLFDGVASLIGLRQTTTYEGQGAAELEWAAAEVDTNAGYAFHVVEQRDTEASRHIVDWRPMIEAIVDQIRSGVDRIVIARKFHNTLSEMIVRVAEIDGQNKVVLTGGCFQNKLLTELSIQKLSAYGFEPYWHSQVPTNDGGISLGQAHWARMTWDER